MTYVILLIDIAHFILQRPVTLLMDKPIAPFTQ